MYILVSGPEDQPVELSRGAWEHVQERHPEMGKRLGDVVLTIEHPDYREPDAVPGRERLFKRINSNLWMRVVLEFNREFERVVTAFLQSKDPRPAHLR